MKLIPAIDIIEGKCVRLTQGDYAQKKIYNENPLEVAKQFEDAGLKYLHLVDLDGAKAGQILNWKVLETITAKTSLQIDFGGGIKRDEDLRIAFSCGASQISSGSTAAKNQSLFLQWFETYGPEKILLGADAMNGKIATNGWQEQTKISVTDFIQQYRQKGITRVICTDIGKDGMLGGPATELYLQIQEQCPGLLLIASGGVSSLQDLETLRDNNLHGAIIGKAIYEGRISLPALKNFC
jgi:phosphoribosylformimino-5-aminoimidazole carboxamide ribotide isomerase